MQFHFFVLILPREVAELQNLFRFLLHSTAQIHYSGILSKELGIPDNIEISDRPSQAPDRRCEFRDGLLSLDHRLISGISRRLFFLRTRFLILGTRRDE